MSPGPVSDSYDPEFSTGQNASDVREAMQEVVDAIGARIGGDLRNIVEVVHDVSRGPTYRMHLSENMLRVIRFGLNRAMESI